MDVTSIPFSRGCRLCLDLGPCTDRMSPMAQGPLSHSDARIRGSWQSADFQEALPTFFSSFLCLGGGVIGPVPLCRCINSFMLPGWRITALCPRPCITVKPSARPSLARERAATLCCWWNSSRWASPRLLCSCFIFSVQSKRLQSSSDSAFHLL